MKHRNGLWPQNEAIVVTIPSPKILTLEAGNVFISLDRAIWRTDLNGTRAIWGVNRVNDLRAIWGTRAIWGVSTGAVDLSSVALFGE